MRGLHQPLFSAERIRLVAGWTTRGFSECFLDGTGCSMVGCHTSIAIGQATAGLTKGTHSPLLYMHIKRERNCFSFVCLGFVHRQMMYHCRPVVLCQQPSLGANSTKLMSVFSS